MSRRCVPLTSPRNPNGPSRWSLSTLAVFALLAAGSLIWPGSLDSAELDKLPSPIVTVLPGDGSLAVQWEQPKPDHLSSFWLPYSDTESGAITIELRPAEVQPEPTRMQLRPVHGGAAERWSDYSFGPCLSGEASCDFGVDVLDVEFPVGDRSNSYQIDTENEQRVGSDESFTPNMVALSRNVELGRTSQAVRTTTAPA